jgi:hypothetical protein
VSEGGDPACWLEDVCERCGAFVEAGADDRHVCRTPARPSSDDVSDDE